MGLEDGVAQQVVRLGIEAGVYLPQPGGWNHAVGVGESQDVESGCIDAHLQGGFFTGQPGQLVLEVDHLETLVLILFQHLQAGIRGMVIDDDHFKVLIVQLQ